MLPKQPISQQEFLSLSPFHRGYWAHHLTFRPDSQAVPDKTNPYPYESYEAKEWARGQAWAAYDREFYLQETEPELEDDE